MAVHIPEVVRCVLRWTGHPSGDFYNVLHFDGSERAAGPPYSAATLTNMADNIRAWWEGTDGYLAVNQFRACVPTSIVLASATATDISGPGGLSVEHGINLPGTSADEPMPGGSAVVASLRTALAGRRYRGRIYLGGLSEDANAGGIVDPLQRSAIESAWQNLVDEIGDPIHGDWRLGVASMGGQAPTTWTPFITRVTTVLVDNKWDSQRRRNRP